jgi:hypothetical protein
VASGGLGGFLFLLALSFVAWYWYRRVFVLLSGPEQAYDRMWRLAALSGLGPLPWQTPLEYSRALGRAMPVLGEDVSLIARAYARETYGHRPSPAGEWSSVVEAWGRVRRTLLRRLVRR